ncbi:MAG: metallophosphoesterase [Chloroflexaceae bacterium]|jgi:hypothetical protein|nr:metallophosphoesterase [Chloroflexaceae bacterium]
MAIVTNKHVPATSREGHRFDPRFVRYSPRWLGAGAALGSLAALAAYRGGLPVTLALGALGAAGAAYATLLEPATPVLERHVFHLPKLPPELSGLRIGQLSDMHLGQPHALANTRWAVQQMVIEQPDLIVLTGDFVSYASFIGNLPELLKPLHAPLGIFAVAGNHDYWEGLDEIQARLAPLGVEFLINRNRRLTWRGAPFTLAGIDDIWDGTPDMAATLAGTQPDDFTLLLAHAPDCADEAAAAGVSLQLSGHTHGGHIHLPWLGSFCLPFHGTRYPIGHEHVGDMQVYVSRGLGGLPLRLGCPPEAAIITLATDER